MKSRLLLAIAFAAALAAGCSSGPKAPDVNLYPLGETTKVVKLSEFKGRAVLIDVWATWCGPCRQTMPLIQKIYDEKGPQGLSVAAVSAESPATIEKYVKESGFTYPFYVDLDNTVSEGFKVTGLPTSIVIDRQGNILFVGHPADETRLHAAIDKALQS